MSAANAADALRAAAEGAMRRAHAPYSRFRVGAALQAADGTIYAGCNVENSSYPAGICAERSALGAAIAAGRNEFTALAIVTEADAPTPPCGMCRQALIEFSARLPIRSYGARDARAEWNLGELLPIPFTGHSMRHA